MGFFEGPATLKRFLSIFSDLIFESSVDPGIPSLTAAPEGPDTLPPLSRRAASMIAFSREGSLLNRASSLFCSVAMGCRESQLSSTEKFSVSETMTDRSMTFLIRGCCLARGTIEEGLGSFCLWLVCFFPLSLQNDQLSTRPAEECPLFF